MTTMKRTHFKRRVYLLKIVQTVLVLLHRTFLVFVKSISNH